MIFASCRDIVSVKVTVVGAGGGGGLEVKLKGIKNIICNKKEIKRY